MSDFFRSADVDLHDAQLVLSAFYAFISQEADKEAGGGFSHFLYPVSTSAKESRPVCAKVLQNGIGQALLELQLELN